MAQFGTSQAQDTGDVVVCFEVAPRDAEGGADVDIHAQRLSQDGRPVWNEGEEPVIVASSSDIETAPVVCDDGSGGVIVVYEIEFAEGEHKGDRDIVAQRLDKDGKRIWNGGDQPALIASSRAADTNPVVLSDGNGGAIVVYEWVDADGESDILAQRIDADGTAVWNEGKAPVIVAASRSIERSPVVVPDGRGGVIVFFERDESPGSVDVMAQRVSADGAVLWNEGDQAVPVSSTVHVERHIAAVPDGQGGAIAAFEFEFTVGDYAGDVDIMAQRISGDGVRLWNEGQGSVTISSGSGIERNTTAVSDGAGGMLAAFEYEPTEGEYAGDVDILAQRLNSNGKMVWQNGERAMTVSSATSTERAPRAVATGDGGFLVAFEQQFRDGEHAGDIDVFAQRLDSDGNMVWEEGKRSVMVLGSEWLEREPVLVADGHGGVIVVCSAGGPEGEFKGDLDVRAQSIGSDGALTWGGGDAAVPVASGSRLERHPCAVLIGGR